MYPYAKCNSFYFMCTLCVNGPLSQCDVEREYVCVCVCVCVCVWACVCVCAFVFVLGLVVVME